MRAELSRIVRLLCARGDRVSNSDAQRWHHRQSRHLRYILHLAKRGGQQSRTVGLSMLLLGFSWPWLDAVVLDTGKKVGGSARRPIASSTNELQQQQLLMSAMLRSSGRNKID